MLETARALGIDVGQGGDLRALARATLEREPAVLILDNLETPLDADEPGTSALVSEWAGLPGVALAATIRRKDRPLGPRWREALEVKPLGGGDARKVFLEIAGRKFENDPRLVEFLKELEGVPLAIELLAKFVPNQSRTERALG